MDVEYVDSTGWVVLARGGGFWTQVIGPFPDKTSASEWINNHIQADSAWGAYFKDVSVEPIFNPASFEGR